MKAFLTLALEEDWWSASRPDRFIPGKKTALLNRRLNEPHCLFDVTEKKEINMWKQNAN